MVVNIPQNLVNKITTHMGWDEKTTLLWFGTKNPHFAELTPLEFLVMRPDKFEKIVDALISENLSCVK